jgi:hypothetical protein
VLGRSSTGPAMQLVQRARHCNQAKQDRSIVDAGTVDAGIRDALPGAPQTTLSMLGCCGWCPHLHAAMFVCYIDPGGIQGP